MITVDKQYQAFEVERFFGGGRKPVGIAEVENWRL
jgi:hypothetical protein